MARRALGRGLEALIPSASTPPLAAEQGTRLAELDLDQIRPNPRQPRETFHNDALDSIASSLREHGVLQPVVVRRVAGGYELIAGERRWRAAQRAGLRRIPAVVRDATPEESLELALVENLQRQNLNPIEEAEAYRRLMTEAGMTQENIAERVGRDRSTVANYLRLLRLPEPVQRRIVAGELTMGHARALLGAADPTFQVRLADEIVLRSLSVREAESRVRAAGRPPQSATGAVRDPDTIAAENQLKRALGTGVRIQGKEKGRIEIRFASLEELDRLYDLLLDRTGVVR